MRIQNDDIFQSCGKIHSERSEYEGFLLRAMPHLVCLI